MTPNPLNSRIFPQGSIANSLLFELCQKQRDVGVPQSLEHLKIALGTNTGPKRQRNEDRVIFAQITSASQGRYALALVCDGVGGTEMGDAAASIAIASVVAHFSECKNKIGLDDLLRAAVLRADDMIRNTLSGKGATTLSILAMSSRGERSATNVGDSRIYSWEPGFSFRQISVDDTLENELKALALKDQSALAAHGLQGRLSQALGEADRRSQDLTLSIYGGEFFPYGILLATDGAWKLNESAFNLIAKEAKTPVDAVRRALAFASWIGGIDNCTVFAAADVSQLMSGTDWRDCPYGLARAIVWTAEGKCIFTQSTYSKIEEDHLPYVAIENKESLTGKAKRKGAVRKKIAASRVEDDGGQLPLDPGGKAPGSRPQLEISIDDASTKDN